MIYNADVLAKAFPQWPQTVLQDGRWVKARPISGTFRWEKLRAAWLVLTGRCDAIAWTGQPDVRSGP